MALPPLRRTSTPTFVAWCCAVTTMPLSAATGAGDAACAAQAIDQQKNAARKMCLMHAVYRPFSAIRLGKLAYDARAGPPRGVTGNHMSHDDDDVCTNTSDNIDFRAVLDA